MPEVKEMAETDNTVSEQESIEKQQPKGVDATQTIGGGQGQEAYPGARSGGEDDRPSTGALPASDNGRGLTSPVETGIAANVGGQSGGIYSGGEKKNSDTYENPNGQPVTDRSADQFGNETGQNGDTPVAGDVDPDSTYSAEETGQDGDPSSRKKSHGHPWNQ